ncbi:hypothetical protein [Winogradskyella alexanderae]|uniref:Uncharacterized protein n=1 Tax=Winogradskyella alexanderae TaxID=2877123 RepID=A0ABS7XRH0_9FLAO|nr:hypothetical protein [Winogradskyella alexanderae]MCA0132603.1 hypothetical protein [Winogradskyella alexanderae]
MEENITNIATVIIAICAIFLTIYQIYATRKHNRLGIRPLLKIGWTTDEKIDGIWLKNVGLGPAIITAFSIKHDGKIITTKDLTNHLHEKGFTSGMYIANKGSTITTTDLKWLIFSEKQLNSEEKVIEYWNLLEGLVFIVEYKCFYNSIQSKTIWKCPNPIKEFVSVKTK